MAKAKIKASAWKAIRKTQYDNYEDYFQVFRGFSKKSYPEKQTMGSILAILCKANYRITQLISIFNSFHLKNG